MIEQLKDNKWYRVNREFIHICCDCSLTHEVKFKLIDNRIHFKWIRNDKKTYKYRQSKSNRKTIINLIKKL